MQHTNGNFVSDSKMPSFEAECDDSLCFVREKPLENTNSILSKWTSKSWNIFFCYFVFKIINLRTADNKTALFVYNTYLLCCEWVDPEEYILPFLTS